MGELWFSVSRTAGLPFNTKYSGRRDRRSQFDHQQTADCSRLQQDLPPPAGYTVWLITHNVWSGQSSALATKYVRALSVGGGPGLRLARSHSA